MTCIAIETIALFTTAVVSVFVGLIIGGYGMYLLGRIGPGGGQ